MITLNLINRIVALTVTSFKWYMALKRSKFRKKSYFWFIILDKFYLDFPTKMRCWLIDYFNNKVDVFLNYIRNTLVNFFLAITSLLTCNLSDNQFLCHAWVGVLFCFVLFVCLFKFCFMTLEEGSKGNWEILENWEKVKNIIPHTWG